VPAYVIRNPSGDPVEIFARDTFQHGDGHCLPASSTYRLSRAQIWARSQPSAEAGNLDANGLGVFGKAAAGML
jgi:hypothetical protein